VIPGPGNWIMPSVFAAVGHSATRLRQDTQLRRAG
jgi:hypothetical protein